MQSAFLALLPQGAIFDTSSRHGYAAWQAGTILKKASSPLTCAAHCQFNSKRSGGDEEEPEEDEEAYSDDEDVSWKVWCMCFRGWRRQ